MPQTKPARSPKFGPRALKILKHLVENPYATQKELLDLIKPESLVNIVSYDYDAIEKREAELKRGLTCAELRLLSKTVNGPPSNRWGCAYLLPKRNGHSEERASLIVRGVVAISHVKRGRCKTYVITPKGMAVLGGLI